MPSAHQPPFGIALLNPESLPLKQLEQRVQLAEVGGTRLAMIPFLQYPRPSSASSSFK